MVNYVRVSVLTHLIINKLYNFDMDFNDKMRKIDNLAAIQMGISIGFLDKIAFKKALNDVRNECFRLNLEVAFDELMAEIDKIPD